MQCKRMGMSYAVCLGATVLFGVRGLALDSLLADDVRGERVLARALPLDVTWDMERYKYRALCLAMIEAYLRPGDRFLDVGTGSGILMIAAATRSGSKLTMPRYAEETITEMMTNNAEPIDTSA